MIQRSRVSYVLAYRCWWKHCHRVGQTSI